MELSRIILQNLHAVAHFLSIIAIYLRENKNAKNKVKEGGPSQMYVGTPKSVEYAVCCIDCTASS